MKRNYLTLGLLSLAIAACGGGENGLDGKDGKDGGSCTVADNGDGSATITCPDGSSFTVKSGEKGQDGQSCKLVENADGSQAVVCPADGSSYIVRGNTDNYANYCAPGFYGKNCENECNCPEHGNCNDGVTGDGSCICETGYYGHNCENECNCPEHGNCNDGVTGDGSCICETGYYGHNCIDCSVNSEYYGTSDCSYTDSRNGNSDVVYPLVRIGEQLWMAENLKATTDINGNAVTCYANTDKDPDFVKKYGCLYVWRELAELDGEIKAENTNRICPTGWHLPETNEIQTFLDNTGASKDSSSSIRSTTWENGSNSSGFGTLPAGYRYRDGSFGSFGYYSFFWSATPSTNNYAYYLEVNYANAIGYYNDVNLAYSVRCLKDQN